MFDVINLQQQQQHPIRRSNYGAVSVVQRQEKAVEPISGCALHTTLTLSANCGLEDTAIQAAEDLHSFLWFLRPTVYTCTYSVCEMRNFVFERTFEGVRMTHIIGLISQPSDFVRCMYRR